MTTNDPESDVYKTPDGFTAVASYREGKKLNDQIKKNMSENIEVKPSRIDPVGEVVKDSEGMPYFRVIRDETEKVSEGPKTPIVATGADAEIVNYDVFNIPKLKKLCKEREIEISSRAVKGDYVQALFEDDEEKLEAEAPREEE